MRFCNTIAKSHKCFNKMVMIRWLPLDDILFLGLCLSIHTRKGVDKFDGEIGERFYKLYGEIGEGFNELPLAAIVGERRNALYLQILESTYDFHLEIGEGVYNLHLSFQDFALAFAVL